MRRLLSAILVFTILFSVLMPISNVFAVSAHPDMTVGSATAKSQYKGDYILAYNPSLSTNSYISSGTLVQSVETTKNNEVISNEPIPFDIHFEEDGTEEINLSFTKATYSVGSKKSFVIDITNHEGSTSSFASRSFECMAVGEHCYVWQPVQSDINNSALVTRPITSAEADQIVSEFESHYDLMVASFGSYPSSYGKLNIMMYNILDNYNAQTRPSYIAGFFAPYDLTTYNGLPMIHIDTYPQLNSGLSNMYSTLFHELQHLIMRSRTSNAPLWLNEMMSAAAQETIYPNSNVPSRINVWNDSSYSDYHCGESLYYFNNDLGAYAMVTMFSEYLRAQTGGSEIFKTIVDNFVSSGSVATAFSNALKGTTLEGLTLSELALTFRIATVARQSDGIYGFKGDTRMNSLTKWTPYGGSVSIYGGGAVLMRGENGIPADSGSGLVYVGIDIDGTVYSDPIGINKPADTSKLYLIAGETVNIGPVTAKTVNGNAQDYIKWTSSNTSVATVDSDGNVKAISSGDCTITATTVVSSYKYTRQVGVRMEEQCKVRFVDWDGTLLKEEMVTFGESATAPDDPTRTGYTFAGWDTAFTAVKGDITVTAKYNVITFTVTFRDYDGTVLKTQTVNYGKSATAPTVSRTGYTFTGWDTDFSNVLSDLVVTAQYTINVYTVTFKDWDGTVLKTESVEYGSSAHAPEVAERYGYSFIGWNKEFDVVSEDLTVIAQYEAYLTYTVVFKDYNGTVLKTQTVDYGMSATAPSVYRVGYTFTGWDGSYTNVTADIVLTAQYKINTYTVTFKDWDGTVLKTEKVEYGSSATAPDAPTRDGYAFIGWDKEFSFISSSITITAQYEAMVQHTVIFKDWDGTVLDTQTVEYAMAATAPTVSRTGYTFTGWDTDFSCVKTDLVVTAQYTINVYTVTFKDWNGTVLKTEEVEFGSDATAPEEPTREGYTFTGWNTDFTNVSADLVVTAQYKINTYTVNFYDRDGETLLKTQTVNYGRAATAPTKPIHIGYVFSAWDTDFSSVKSDLNVVAIYVECERTVTFKYLSDNTTISTVQVPNYDTLTMPTAPSHMGKKFVGWYYNNSSLKKLTVSSNITVYAVYEEVVHIKSVNDLYKIRAYLGGNYVLDADISSTSAMLPIGMYSASNVQSFTGTFDGQNHTVNLNFSYSSIDNIGMFASNAGTIKNIDFLANAQQQVYGNENVGAIAGFNEASGIISHCTVTTEYALAISGSAYVGAIAGYNLGIIEYCTNTSTITRPIAANYCGGIAGANEGTIRNCQSFSDPCGFENGEVIGGIVGINAGIVSECSVTGYVGYGQYYTSVSIVGGIAGYAYGTTGIIENCYVNMDNTRTSICGYSYIGGLVGIAEGGILRNCYVKTGIGYSSTEGLSYGIGLKEDPVVIENCYAYNVNAHNLTAKVTSWEALKSVAIAWDWTNIWEYSSSAVTLKNTPDTFADEHTVVFTAIDGTAISVQTVAHGGNASAPTAPEAEGLAFKGWDTSYTNVTYDIYVRPIYETATYTVTFYDMNGNEISAQTVEYGQSATAPTAPAVFGYEFVEWDKDFSCVKADLTVNAVYRKIEVTPESAHFAIKETSACESNNVMVGIEIANNPGFANAHFDIVYDGNLLSFVSMELAKNVKGLQLDYTAANGKITVTLSADADYTANGNILSMVFTVCENAQTGAVAVISMRYGASDIVNAQSENVYILSKDGSVTVRERKIGDASGDGVVNTVDAMLMLRVFAGWDNVNVDPKALDVNGDGIANMVDVLLLMRYLAGWQIPYFA